MTFPPIFEGWDFQGRLSRRIRQTFSGFALNRDVRGAIELAQGIEAKLAARALNSAEGQHDFARAVVETTFASSVTGEDFKSILADCLANIIVYEHWFAIPRFDTANELTRSDLWEIEDQLKRVEAIVDHLDQSRMLAGDLMAAIAEPFLVQPLQTLTDSASTDATILFETNLRDILPDPPQVVETVLQAPFVPDFEMLTPRLRERLQYNLHIASGSVPGDPKSVRTAKLPTQLSGIAAQNLPKTYLDGTPLLALFDHAVTIVLPEATRFEHMHIVAGSGHGKTQTLQHFILNDLDAVARGEASIVVIDSQSDLINTIAGLDLFAPGGPLGDRLVLIDPTDLEWPVALNLFDVGMDRLDSYSQLDRERLTNSILELYDFVLGSLLDAGLTQKQNVIFRYITRLLLHIPEATIHTLRALLEEGGADRYRKHITKLQGSARAFFEHEFSGKEFAATKRQVLRRLYGILENQTFERMFSHPKSKLDLFVEMNAGKVILINTAKDLLKESGTEIFGRFFIAMIAQAAQERAVLPTGKRLPTFVYIDEANDYFDRNIGIILSQARKYNVGMVLAHQFLGQLDSRLHEAIAANTSIKFAGGVSAKDARALAGDLRIDAMFIERQPKLSFAAFIKGETDRAVSLQVEAGQMERLPKMSEGDWLARREITRERYAVHYSELNNSFSDAKPADTDLGSDDGEPHAW